MFCIGYAISRACAPIGRREAACRVPLSSVLCSECVADRKTPRGPRVGGAVGRSAKQHRGTETPAGPAGARVAGEMFPVHVWVCIECVRLGVPAGAGPQSEQDDGQRLQVGPGLHQGVGLVA